MRCIRNCFVIGIMLLAAGCRTTTQSDKFMATGYSAKATKMLIAYYLNYDPVILDNRRLQEGVASGLARCGVQSRSEMLNGVMYNGFPAEYANSATADVDAILVVSEGDSRMAKFAEAMMGGRRGESARNYDVALFDRRAMERVWGAQVTVAGSGFLIYKAEEKTDNFARDLVGYLAADGIIPACAKAPG